MRFHASNLPVKMRDMQFLNLTGFRNPLGLMFQNCFWSQTALKQINCNRILLQTGLF
jgi:hypothetical protein